MTRRLIFIAAILFVASLFLIISFYPDWNTEEREPYFGEDKSRGGRKNPNVLEFVKEQNVDDQRSESLKRIGFAEKYVTVGGANVYAVFPELKGKVLLSVLLLHGAAFSSETWQRIGTLQFLLKQNYFPIAVDLPGLGKSSKTPITDRNGFLSSLIKTLGIEKPVVISPSMSGRYSIPHFILHPNELSGYVPIAPVMDSTFSDQDFKKSNVSTLIIYGENDVGTLEKNKVLSAIPNSRVVMIPKAGHPCYLDDTPLFHKTLLDFLRSLK
nr:protein ABHD14B [Ciona intestinalis]|eukprot:XP_002128863.1 protein ABHD14B [Ciona intestinalis]